MVLGPPLEHLQEKPGKATISGSTPDREDFGCWTIMTESGDVAE